MANTIALDPSGLPNKVTAAATGTGTTGSSQFTVQGRALGGPINCVLQAVVTGTFSALVVSLTASLDGGTTFSTIEGNIDLHNSPIQVISPQLQPGILYQLSIATFTGGTSVDIWASAS